MAGRGRQAGQASHGLCRNRVRAYLSNSVASSYAKVGPSFPYALLCPCVRQKHTTNTWWRRGTLPMPATAVGSTIDSLPAAVQP